MTVAEVVQRLLETDAPTQREQLLSAALAEHDVEELLTALKAEAERQWTKDPHASLRLAEALILGATMAAKPTHHALGLMAKADALRFLGRYPESLEYFEQSANEFLNRGDDVGWARTRIGWIVTIFQLGRAASELPVADRAHEVLVKHGEWFRAAGLNLNAAVVCRWLGRYSAAIDRYHRALELYARARSTWPLLEDAIEPREASAKANMAIVRTLLGDFPAAIALHEEAYETFKRHGEILSALRQRHNLALVYAGRGQFTHALALLTETVADAGDAGFDELLAATLIDMCDCNLALNRDTAARDLADRAIAVCERSGTPMRGAMARMRAGQAHARLGNLDRASLLVREAQQIFADSGLESDLANASMQLAGLHLANEDWRSALEVATEARRAFRRTGEWLRLAQSDLVCARALIELNRPGRALRKANSALSISKRYSVPWLAPAAYHVMANVAETADDLPGAVARYELAVSSIERVQSGLLAEYRSDFIADKMKVYHDAIDCCLRLDNVRGALDFLERAKSRALVDYLAQNVDVKLPGAGSETEDATRKLTQLREEHNWFYNRLYSSSFDTDRSTLTAAEIDRLQQELRDREDRISGALERLLLRGSAHDTLMPVLSHAPRVSLDPGTVLLEYYIRDDVSRVFVIASDGIAVVNLETSSRAIRQLVDRWRLNLDATAGAITTGEPLSGLANNARGILRQLHHVLIRPVLEHLVACERVVVVPNGPLHSVPFHALHDGEEYAIERWNVSVCPSSAVFALCKSRAPRSGDSACVVAYSDAGRLPYVLIEAAEVAKLFPGDVLIEEHATRAAVHESTARHRLIHIAAHADARVDNPTFAHVRLSDGQLTTSDVFNLDLNGAIVTLSACETGRGVLGASDEVIGLSRAVLHAGASTLIHSLWRVEDGSTSSFMTNLYKAMRSGKPCGTSMREPACAVMQAGTAHPYSWAAFQVVGDGGAHMRMQGSASPHQELTGVH